MNKQTKRPLPPMVTATAAPQDLELEEELEDVQEVIASKLAEIDNMETAIGGEPQSTVELRTSPAPSLFNSPEELPTLARAVPVTVWVPANRVVQIMGVRAGQEHAAKLDMAEIIYELGAHLDEFLTLPPALDTQPILERLLELQTEQVLAKQEQALEWPVQKR